MSANKKQQTIKKLMESEKQRNYNVLYIILKIKHHKD